MWGLPWEKGTYRLENQNKERLEKLEANGRLQTEVMLLALGAVASSGVCCWCGVRPAENNARNSCTECEDLLLSCC